ncbi:MAG: DsrH/TusB family sulfur relay protein, partial [Alkalimonas sp.]|nr:DsrH/TusB family sulfur relay protein [Alkalimonas sp.]
LLLRQDGVYAMLRPWPKLACRCYALAHDIHARALTAPSHWQPINDQQWVELAAQAEQVVLCPKL